MTKKSSLTLKRKVKEAINYISSLDSWTVATVLGQTLSKIREIGVGQLKDKKNQYAQA